MNPLSVLPHIPAWMLARLERQGRSIERKRVQAAKTAAFDARSPGLNGARAVARRLRRLGASA